MARRRIKAKDKKRAAEESLAKHSPLRNLPGEAMLPIPTKLKPVAHRLAGDGRQRRGHVGRPDRMTRTEKRGPGWHNPDEREKQIRDLNAHHREAIKASPDEDGLITGPLEAAAYYQAQRIGEVNGIADPQVIAGITLFLKAKLGEAIRTFDPAEYEEWRQDCERRAQEWLASQAA